MGNWSLLSHCVRFDLVVFALWNWVKLCLVHICLERYLKIPPCLETILMECSFREYEVAFLNPSWPPFAEFYLVTYKQLWLWVFQFLFAWNSFTQRWGLCLVVRHVSQRHQEHGFCCLITSASLCFIGEFRSLISKSVTKRSDFIPVTFLLGSIFLDFFPFTILVFRPCGLCSVFILLVSL